MSLMLKMKSIEVFGDLKFVSNIFHIHFTLWKVSKDSEMVNHLGG